MQTPSEIIELLGGTSAVARELGLTPSTVSSWKQLRAIPNWRMDGIRKLAKAKGVTLNLAGKAA